jgi:hypothetical protein
LTGSMLRGDRIHGLERGVKNGQDTWLDRRGRGKGVHRELTGGGGGDKNARVNRRGEGKEGKGRTECINRKEGEATTESVNR